MCLCFSDYSKVPRSSGDGMEFSTSDMPESISVNDADLRKHPSESLDNGSKHSPHQSFQVAINPSVESKHFIKEKHPETKLSLFTENNLTLEHDAVDRQWKDRTAHQKLRTEAQRFPNAPLAGKLVVSHQSERKTNVTKNLHQSPQILNERGNIATSHFTHSSQNANFTSDLQPPQTKLYSNNCSPVLTKHQSQNTSMEFPSQNKNQEVTPESAFSAKHVEDERGDVSKTTVIERGAEFMESQSVIRELEERNSKLVEEKTKLVVQLGVQTKVKYQIKCSLRQFL